MPLNSYILFKENMKSVYLNNETHRSLKIFASFEKKKLSEVVEEGLLFFLRRKMADLPAELIAKLAQAGGSFGFLSDKKEEVYSADDGEPLS